MESLAADGGTFQTIVVDNGTGSAKLDRVVSALEGCEVMRLDSNVGYSRAVNLASERADGEALVLLNDDSVVEPGFVEAITRALDPGAGVVMAAGVMRDAASPGLIETAGIEIDRTLLAFDYLNGEPVEILEGEVADPLGPSGAAAAIWREAFTAVGGFDEALFAYGEDTDLALRLQVAGASCRLARGATGLHEHSATLGSGSRRKDYLMGYARGYLLRKWDVLRPRRVPAVLAREVIWVAGQAIIDRNLGGLRGRVNGLRGGTATEAYPPAEVLADPPTFAESLGRRWRRRARLRSRDRASDSTSFTAMPK